jgi:hypothetical protein
MPVKSQSLPDEGRDDVGLLADAEAMRSLIDRSLRPAGQHAPAIVACSVTFARRGEGRSIAQYRATLRDTATGQERSQEFTSVSYGKGRTRDMWQVMQPSLPPAHAASPFAPAAYIPEKDIILQTVPFDHALPGLARLLDEPFPALESALMRQFGAGAWRLTGWQAETLRYRVTLRACLRLDARAEELGTNRSAERRFYAKVYGSAEDAERTWQVQRDLDRALRDGPPGLNVPAPVAFLRNERILIQDAAAGISLAALRRGEDEAAIHAGVRRAAWALATLHQLEMVGPGQRRKLPRAGAPRMQRAADRLRSTVPSLTPLTNEVETAILAGLAALEDLPAVPVHGDFKPHHVLLSEDRVTLLDVDKFDTGEPMLDVTTMLRQIGQNRSLANLFAEEYFAGVAPAWQSRLVPYYAAMLVQDAATLDRSTHAGKGKRSGSGVGHAEALLDHARAMLATGDWRS